MSVVTPADALGTAAWILDRTRRRSAGLAVRVAAIVVPIHRAAEHLSRAAGVALIPFDLQPSEFEVLQTLLLADDEPLTPSDLYRALLVSSGGLTKILDRLQRREMISIATDAEDKRRRRIALTASGRALAGRAEQAVIAAEAECLRPILSDPANAGLAQLLPRMITTLEGEDGSEASRRTIEAAG